MTHRQKFYEHKWASLKKARNDKDYWYEREKDKLRRMGLSPRDYEVAIRELCRELHI